jgi:hypothetical protein
MIHDVPPIFHLTPLHRREPLPFSCSTCVIVQVATNILEFPSVVDDSPRVIRCDGMLEA